ncbi:MAG: TadE/TadG family type IV pilus assembly protein [Mariniblastus sp.]
MARIRKGAAIIEMAICLPVLLLIVFGTIELSTSIFLKQTLTSAAHEGALTGMRVNATEQQIIDRVEGVLAARAIDGCTVSVSPSGTAFSDLTAGEMFSVRVAKDKAFQYLDITGVNVSISTQRQ